MLYGRNGRKDDLVVRGARVLDPVEGVDVVLDVRVDKGVIAALGEGLDANGHRVVDGDGLVLAPGFVDPHVHLRVPAGDTVVLKRATHQARPEGDAPRSDEPRRRDRPARCGRG